MRKLLFALIIISGSIKAQAQDVNNTVKINPLSALFRIGSVFYERKLSDKTSAQLGVAYTGLKLDDTKFTGIAITPEYRIYPKGKAIEGVYIGPFARYQDYTVKSGDSKGSYSSIGGGVVFGRQW